MKRSKFFLLGILFLLCSSLGYSNPMMMPRQGEQLVIQNRILARINDQTITVMDVMDKMALFLKKHYPKESQSPMTRAQFFINNWRDVLDQMIDQELIVYDATQMELKITDKEIRERLLMRFGSNVMTALDETGITYEKARDMMRKEIAVEMMTMFRVHRKAFQHVGPHEVKKAYQDFCKKNPPSQEWTYRVVSIRGKDSPLAQEVAKKAHKLLAQENFPLDKLKEKLKEELGEEAQVSINVSDSYTATDTKVSQQHRTVLESLTPNSYSSPIRQKSRFDQSDIHRIFWLTNHTEHVPPPFEEVADRLQDELMDAAVAKETSIYVDKLRKRFGFEKKSLLTEIPDDFEPFSLK